MRHKKICFIFGTRPEAIKVAPVSTMLRRDGHFEVVNISTGQHKEMLNQVLDFFNLPVNNSLDVMKVNQSLAYLSSSILDGLSRVLEELKPDLVLVQGDTTTAFMGALAAFYQKIPVAHIEAGLRSFNLFSPFPEEANRKMISQIANLHFCPTDKAVENLNAEGIHNHVYKVGNTVVDALLQGLDIIEQSMEERFAAKYAYLLQNKFILVTGHRRESFGDGFLHICHALKKIAEKFPDTPIFYPVHLNPSVQKPVYEILSGLHNVYLVSPLEYAEMIWVLNKSYIVLTDSGGIQEEAPSLGKPILVMREVTERSEGIDAGNAVLVGTDQELIFNWVERLLSDPQLYTSMSTAGNPYGDGLTSERILSIIKNYLDNE